MKKEKKYPFLYIIIRNSAEYFKKGGTWGIIEQSVAILRALSWTVEIITMQMLFDTVAETTLKKGDFLKITYCLSLFAIAVIGQQLLSVTGQYLLSKVSYSNMGKFMAEFQRKLGRVAARNFEDTEFLNNVNKAKECLEYESLGHFASICLQLFTYYSVYFISVGGYLFWLSPILPLVILLAFFPAFIGQLVQAKMFEKLEEENALLRRQYEHYRKAIVGREFYKETRMLGAFQFFHHLFMETLSSITEKRWNAEYKAGMLRILLNIVSFIGLGISIVILFNSTMDGSVSIGSFVSVFVALSQIFSIMEEIVSSHLSEGSETLGQVTNYYRLMDMAEAEGKEESPDFTKGIKAENIKFTYPGREDMAVNGAEIIIKAGETVAVVGENGSGKSTLVKLLTGLYIPDEGNVEIGGQNTRTTAPSSLFKGISGIFQNYQRYKMTLSENVTISDVTKLPDSEKIIMSLKEAEFNADDTTLETMLSPEFDGIDLSGGQWQRLAIARGLYRSSNFIVLDEPTAAIDPVEEARLYRQFGQLIQGKCGIIVTHRLGSVKLADYIAVMDKGRIVDIGTHEELLSRKGKYADMWKKQSSWYEGR